jgi:hypothetical protein
VKYKIPFLWTSLARPVHGLCLPLQLSPKTNINHPCFHIYSCAFRSSHSKLKLQFVIEKRKRKNNKLVTPIGSSYWLKYKILTRKFTWIPKSFDFISRCLLYAAPASKLNSAHFHKVCTTYAFRICLTKEVIYCLNCTNGFLLVMEQPYASWCIKIDSLWQ